jgi:hypothetical protein
VLIVPLGSRRLGRDEKLENMNPNDLPSIKELRATAQSLAMLDAILSPEWQYRYFSFDSKWAPGMEMASMRNGCGDDWHLLFDSVGAALKGFAHELASDFSFPNRLRTEVPDDFASFLNEPAFSMESATFCYWRKVEDAAWHKVRSFMPGDGAAEMLDQIVAGPAGYKDWAESYFEVAVDLQSVCAVFDHAPLSKALILALNPEADIALTFSQAVEIGYLRCDTQHGG